MDSDQISYAIEQQLFRSLHRRRVRSQLWNLEVSLLVDFSSNDFLSLSTSPQLYQSLIAELQSRPPQLGSTGSRLLDGNSDLAESLERELAAFHRGQAGLLTNSGFNANISLFSCLPQSGDVILYDELIHASSHDGMRQSRAAACIEFAHNSVTDLRRRLKTCKEKYVGVNIFIAVESVYSMEGDLAPLVDMADLIEELFPQKSAHLIVDEAHATGIYGAQGRGRVSELGLENRVFLRLHTFGKALACNGGRQRPRVLAVVKYC
jgi:8-amino-7-oxononanoate synthase